MFTEKNHLINFKNRITNDNLLSNRSEMKTLQLNLGKRCNQSCVHCHVDAGPKCTEMMTLETASRIIELLKENKNIETVDITGGAPELNPHFRYLVKAIRQMGIEVIDRCNLTVFFEEGQADTAQFLADHQVMVIASMPCYLESNVDAQRGNHVYEKSIKALQMLNALGYGKPDSGLILNLVFNPSGIGLPPEQSALESDYKRNLKENYGIEFNQLLTITNMPIKRFRNYLEQKGQLTAYEQLLAEKFNPVAVERIMCRELISISWDGKLYDCDFNQALNIPITSNRTIWDIDSLSDVDKEIVFNNHCYGCTAGSGSSCKGALV